MIRKYKKTLILTSLLTLLPMVVGLLLWNRLPDKIATHWSFTGEANGWSSLSTAVFGLPLLMLAVQWLCVWITAKDPGNQSRNEKPQKLVLWIIPVVSNLCCGMMYALALGAGFSVTDVMVGAMGVLFIAIGNYLPKCKTNSTIGIKIPWVYTSEENWNATHRFGGKLWVLGGVAIALGSLLPGEAGLVVMLVLLIALVVVPTVYSWRFYKREKAAGKASKHTLTAKDRKTVNRSRCVLVLILAGIGYLMFSGDITVSYGPESFTVKADYHEDLTVPYDAIDSIEFREGNVEGVRVMGFGSARLLLGTFENEEFGYHTRYTYTSPDACIVVKVGEKVLVLSSQTASQTKSIYLDLLDLTGLE